LVMEMKLTGRQVVDTVKCNRFWPFIQPDFNSADRIGCGSDCWR
jgi:hypothetical protein